MVQRVTSRPARTTDRVRPCLKLMGGGGGENVKLRGIVQGNACQEGDIMVSPIAN